MIHHKIQLVVVVILSMCMAQKTYTMDSIDNAHLNDGKSRRQAILCELPEINKSGSEFFAGTITYKDDKFVEKLLDLVGPTMTKLDARDGNIHDTINKSIQVRTGHSYIDDRDVCISTGNIYDCVAIAIQHANPNLVALYHYYQKADENFIKLDGFLSDIKNKVDQLKIKVSDLATVLVSSYVSSNFVIIKRALQGKGFNITASYLRSHAYLSNSFYVNSKDIVTSAGRLVVVSPSDLKVYQYVLFRDPGEYASDLPRDEDDCYFIS